MRSIVVLYGIICVSLTYISSDILGFHMRFNTVYIFNAKNLSSYRTAVPKLRVAIHWLLAGDVLLCLRNINRFFKNTLLFLFGAINQ